MVCKLTESNGSLFIWMNKDNRTLSMRYTLPAGVRNKGLISPQEQVSLTGSIDKYSVPYNDRVRDILKKCKGISPGILQRWEELYKEEEAKENIPAEDKEPDGSNGRDIEPDFTKGLRDFYKYLDDNKIDVEDNSIL